MIMKKMTTENIVTMSKATVMIVDDADDNRMLQRMILEEHYTIIEVESGEECLEKVNESPPDIILLDVNMLKMNGYETCTQLRRQAKTSSTPIIFISAMYKPEERLSGYESGADDYIIKPIDGEKLLERVQYHLHNHEVIVAAQEKAKSSMSLAIDAINYRDEVKQLLYFMEEAQALTTLEEAGEKICDAAMKLGLQACAYIIKADKPYIYCAKDSLEAKVLDKAKSSNEPIITIGIRTIFKSDQIALLIKNMPTDNQDKYARIKDHLTALLYMSNGILIPLQLCRCTQQTTLSQSLQDAFYRHDNEHINRNNIVETLTAKIQSIALHAEQESELIKMTEALNTSHHLSLNIIQGINEQITKTLPSLNKPYKE